ncbi:MAG: FKBP-type peptidyl-prolyl cis-trans isomerase [Rikenellaceae bacterium]
MRKIIIFSAVVAAIFSSCGNNSVSLKNQQDSVAYAIGVYYGAMAYSVDSTMDVKTAAAGFAAAMSRKADMKAEDALKYVNNYLMIEKPRIELRASKEYLKQMEANPKVKKTESGLLYEIIETGDLNNKAVVDTDKARVIYEGSLRNGHVFDSAKQRGDTATFPLNGVIKGWTEGLKLIGKGGKIILYIPSELAYGNTGTRDGSIGPCQALRFEVELVDILPDEKAREEAAKAEK